MTIPSPDEPFDPFGKLGADVKPPGTGAGGRLPHSTIRTMFDNFAAMVNERCVDRRYGYAGSETKRDFPSLEEFLFCTKEMQEPPRGGSVVHLTGRSDESLGHAVENGWKECDSPKSGWGRSKSGYVSSLCR